MFSDGTGISNVNCFFVEGKNQKTRINFSEQSENQQQTQPCDAGFGPGPYRFETTAFSTTSSLLSFTVIIFRDLRQAKLNKRVFFCARAI